MADVFVEVEPGKLRTVAEQFSAMPQISYVACATGDTDIILSVRATDIHEMYAFVLDEVGKIPGVRDTRIHILPLKIKDNASWIPPSALGDEEGS